MKKKAFVPELFIGKKVSLGKGFTLTKQLS